VNTLSYKTKSAKKEEVQRNWYIIDGDGEIVGRNVIEKAVRGMLPKTKLGRAMIKKLFVYEGTEHPHLAQKPEPFKF